MPYTAAQICSEACKIAKVPGYLSMAGQHLNLVLDDLVQHRNLKVNLVTSSIALTPGSTGPYNLETDYLRTYDLFYLIQGEPYFLEPCSLRQMDAEVQLSGLSNYPTEWASDLSPVADGNPGLLYIYPPPSTSLTLTHRYYLRQADIVTPEESSEIPWFTDQDYLISAVAMRLMRVTDDDRFQQYVGYCDKMLEAHLLTEGDEQQVVKEVRLDPRRFKVNGFSRPTKLDPF